LVKNNAILSRLYTQDVFNKMVHDKRNSTYETVIQRYVDDPEDKANGELISEVYHFMSKEYRNEYFYQNTLLNKLLLGKHSINTTTALKQIPINRSKADFILINGKGVVYEIKTELDTLDRLDTQLADYHKAFDHVCIVTAENHFDRALELLSDTPVGIYVLTKNNTISKKLLKEPRADNSKLNHTVIFKLLHKYEQEDLLLQYYRKLPSSTPAFYYGKCMEWFLQIPILRAYDLALKQLKKRNKVLISELEKVPYELKSLMYFSKPTRSDWDDLHEFLRKRYKG